MRKSINLILMVLIMVICFTVPTFAAETSYDLSANGDGSVMAVFDDETGLLTISGSGTMADYTTSSSTRTPLYSILSSVKEVVVEEGVTTLGDYVFFGSTSNCLSNCTTVSLPSTLTSIGDKNFYFAPYVSNFSCLGDISDFGVEFFGSPTSKNSLIGSKASDKTATVHINQVYMKEALEGLGYSVSTVGQTTISASESYPSSNVYELGTPTSTDVMGYYNEYSKVFKIEGSGAIKDSSGYGLLGSSNYNKVNEVIIGEGITSLGEDAFRSSSLKRISLPSTLSSIGDSAFAYSSLESITIPANVKSIGESAFHTTSKLSSVTFEDGSKLESIGYLAFSNASALTAIELPASVISIGDYAFNQCTALKDFICLSYPLEIGTNTFNNMGRNASNKTATVSANNVFLKETLESLGYTVSTSGTQTVDRYASYPTAYAIEVGANGDNIIAYVNPYSGSLEVKGSGATADYDCSSAYYATNSPLGAYLAGTIQLTIDEGITYLGNNLFHGVSSSAYLSSISSIELPSSLIEIGESTFYHLGASTITIPANVETIGAKAFWYADLTSITFENGSKLKTMGDTAFRDTDITSIEIPDGVTSIGNHAFSSCYELTRIVIPASVTSIGQDAFIRYGENSDSNPVVYNYGGAEQTIGSQAFYQNSGNPAPTVYQYQANTAMTTALSESKLTPEAVYYFDDIALSGDLDNGIHWEYDPDTKTLTFTGNGDIPDFEDGTQPWYAAASQHGGVGTYQFGDGITGIGNGIFGSYGNSAYGSNGSGASAYGPAGLGYGGATYAGTLGGSGGGGGSSSGGAGGGGGSSSEGNTGSGSEGSGTEGTDTPPVDKDAMIILDAVPTNFMVTVPIAINVVMDADGTITTGDGYVVANECAWGPVIINNIKVVAETNWTLTDWNSDFANMRASTKKLALTINGVEVGADGSVVMNDSLSSVIKYQTSKELFFNAKLPAQKVALQENIAAVVFTVDFDKV